MKRLIPIIAFAFAFLTASAERTASKVELNPTGTYIYAHKDGQDLLLDYYAPGKDSRTSWNGHDKPTILFIFGGGFKTGRRDESEYKRYYRILVENGYPVVAIDYRLGMKGATVKNAVASFGIFYDAIHIAVDDLYSATEFLIGNADKLGIDSDNIVVAGSSAGAITALQGVWESGDLQKERLGKDFSYKAVISFAGGLISKTGKPSFQSDCCPILLFQGKEDKIVNYKKIQLFNMGFFGSSSLRKILNKTGIRSQIFRFDGIGHEIAGQMTQTFHYQDEFLKRVVMEGEKYDVDASVTDPSIPRWNIGNSTSDLYDGK